jgi:hypothetical protein
MKVWFHGGLCSIAFFFLAMPPPENCRGVSTHAPFQALACPQKNAFGTPDAGVLQALPFDQECQFWNGQRPKLANYWGSILT